MSERTWKQRARGWAIDIAVVLVIFAGVSAWQNRKLLPVEERPAPDFALRTLDGEVVSLSDFEGRAVQLHFWATWCGVCGREHAALEAVNASTNDERALLTIAVDSGSAADVAAYAEEHGLSYAIALDEGSVSSAYRVSAFPTNYYLDRDHRIVGRDVGMATRWGMRWRLSRAAR